MRPPFSTPEQAAVAGFPPGVARVISSRIHGPDAYVLLDTGANTQQYLYGTHCHLIEDAWVEGNSSNGGGWASSGRDDDLGVLTLWDTAPPGADRVRATFAHQPAEVDVENGAYLFAWWDVPYDHGAWPSIDAVRVNGDWVTPPRGLER